MYRMFYNHDVSGDTLFIVLSTNKTFDHGECSDDVYALYSGDNELIGININNLSRVLKIKAHGMIVTPGKELVDVVNHILKRAKLPTLPYCTDSGYKVGTVSSIENAQSTEKYKKIMVDVGDKEMVAITSYNNLKIGDYVVLALDGTIQYNGATFRTYAKDDVMVNCLICNAKELRINADSEGAFVVDGYRSGEDFYLAGE